MSNTDSLVEQFAAALENGEPSSTLCDAFFTAFFNCPDHEKREMLAGALGFTYAQYKRLKHDLPGYVETRQAKILDLYDRYLGIPEDAGMPERNLVRAAAAQAERNTEDHLRNVRQTNILMALSDPGPGQRH